MRRKILRNRFKCNKCGDIIESQSVHDFVTCKCGSISTDGGHEYIRVVLAQGMASDDFEDLCEWESEEASILYKDVNGGTDETEGY